MRTQTFITKLEGDNNRMITFERWADKMQATVKRKVIKLYKHYLLKSDLEKLKYLVIYKTEGDKQIEVERIERNEFISLMQ